MNNSPDLRGIQRDLGAVSVGTHRSYQSDVLFCNSVQLEIGARRIGADPEVDGKSVVIGCDLVSGDKIYGSI